MIQFFGDVAVDPADVLVVSRVTGTDVSSTMLVKAPTSDPDKHSAAVVDISQDGAAALLEHFKKTSQV